MTRQKTVDGGSSQTLRAHHVVEQGGFGQLYHVKDLYTHFKFMHVKMVHYLFIIYKNI